MGSQVMDVRPENKCRPNGAPRPACRRSPIGSDTSVLSHCVSLQPALDHCSARRPHRQFFVARSTLKGLGPRPPPPVDRAWQPWHQEANLMALRCCCQRWSPSPPSSLPPPPRRLAATRRPQSVTRLLHSTYTSSATPTMTPAGALGGMDLPVARQLQALAALPSTAAAAIPPTALALRLATRCVPPANPPFHPQAQDGGPILLGSQQHDPGGPCLPPAGQPGDAASAPCPIPHAAAAPPQKKSSSPLPPLFDHRRWRACNTFWTRSCRRCWPTPTGSLCTARWWVCRAVKRPTLG